MRSTLFKGVVLGVVTSALILAATSALAGTGVGGIFNLGKINTVNGTSSLSGATAGAQLKVLNTSTASTGVGASAQSKSATGAAVQGVNTAGGPGLQAIVKNNTVAPLKVNSTHVVPGLNAALLGGFNSASFVKGGGRLVSNHRTISVGTMGATLLTLPGIGSINVSCVSGPKVEYTFADTSGHAFNASRDIEGTFLNTSVGMGFTTGDSATNEVESLVLNDSTNPSGPTSVVRLWKFPSSPDSTHCFFQGAAVVQP